MFAAKNFFLAGGTLVTPTGHFQEPLAKNDSMTV